MVWLDLPGRTVRARVARRAAARVLTRRELWNGNRESWRNLLRRDPARGVRWVRLRSPDEVARWLDEVSS